jgi:hypothetical protein
MAERKNGSMATPATKMEAVEQTLKELGSDTMPMAIKEHLKKRYGMEISAAVASDYKKKVKQRAKAATTPDAAKPAVTPPVAQAPAPLKKAAVPAKKTVPPVKKVAAPKSQASGLETPKKANGANGGSVLLDDVLTAKALLDRVGFNNLRTLIEGLAR